MIMALILNIIVTKPMAKAVRIPTEILVPLVLILAFLGSYALRHSLFDMSLTLVFGILGYYMDRYGYSTVCMVLAMILGSIASESFFQAWKIGDRSFTIFFTRPLSIGLIVFLVLSMVGPYAYQLLKKFAVSRR